MPSPTRLPPFIAAVLTTMVLIVVSACKEELSIDDRTPAEEASARALVLRSATTLRCAGGRGVTTSWVRARTPDFGAPAPIFADNSPLVFDAIDTLNQRARFVGNAGAEDVRFSTSAAGLHFVEQTLSGSIILTTVFVVGTRAMSRREFPFVHSRHVSGFGMPPTVSQFSGVCAVQ